MVAHIEGTVTHLREQNQCFNSDYKSDKGGFKSILLVKPGDSILIKMEVVHFASFLVQQGSSEMQVQLLYDKEKEENQNANHQL